MKITTWNVNGYRAAIKKDFKASVEQLETDVLCLQELKARADQVPEADQTIPGFSHVWNSAERPGYSGVATYIRDGLVPLDTKLGLGFEHYDLEGRVIRHEFDDFFLYNIYFPNGQRGQERVDFKLDFYSTLLDQCNEIHKEGKSIIITGDFNTAHQEIDLANPKENQKTSGFLPEERAWITKYLDTEFVDAFRFLYPEKEQFTWWTYRFNARARGIGWRLDYFLVSNVLMKRVRDVQIHDQILGSDHCPVSLMI